MLRIKLVFISIVTIAVMAVLADFMILKLGDNVERRRCVPFETVSTDPRLNERLRNELADFINDEKNRRKLEGVLGLEFTIFTEHDFDTHFPWSVTFEKYPVLQQQLVLVLSFDPVMDRLTPPYRITKIGLYGDRSLLMYKNENVAQYEGGEGSVRLSTKPSIKCPVTFSHGVPVEQSRQ